jgi:hypothetical protein
MIHGFPELVIGGVLIAPFVSYALAALALFFLVRPALSLVNFEAAFSNPPLALLCIYIAILAILIVLF